jgi:hypothetical protein
MTPSQIHVYTHALAENNGISFSYTETFAFLELSNTMSKYIEA